MTEDQLYEVAYNAHEKAEAAAYDAFYGSLRAESVDALACLADPAWRWEQRSWMSAAIIDAASEILDEKLETLVAVDEDEAKFQDWCTRHGHGGTLNGR